MTRTRLATLVATALLVPGALLAPSAAAHPTCAAAWGSLEERSGAPSAGEAIVDVRVGQHECFDRLVVDIAGGNGSEAYDVRYVPQGSALGTGSPVPVRGGAVLQVLVEAPAHDEDYQPTVPPPHHGQAVAVDGFDTFRQVEWGGSFEGRTALAVGVEGRLPFRAFTLPGVAGSGIGTRLVIDVAHTW